MPCYVVQIPGGGTAIVTMRGRRSRYCACGRRGTLQCDYVIGEGRTCDKYLCAHCAVHDAPDRDYCHDHRIAPRQGSLFR
jgi:hypothetical protein